MRLMSYVWKERTDLEKGLILVIVVLIPVILLLAAIYIYSAITGIPSYSDRKTTTTAPDSTTSNSTDKPTAKETPTTKPPGKETPTTKPPANESPTTKPPAKETPTTKPPAKETPTTKPPPKEPEKRAKRSEPQHIINKNKINENQLENSKRSADLVKRSIPVCDCINKTNDCSNIFQPYKFISSISETIFEDDPNEYKFKCSAILLTESYILTFNNCLSTNASVKIRSSSEYWSKGGYIRQISSYNIVKELFIVAKLMKPLLNDSTSVKTVEFSKPKDVKEIKQFDAYRWNFKFDKQRKNKYDKLTKIQLNVTKCTYYNDVIKKYEIFCATEERKPFLNDKLDNRDPIFETGSNKLIGMEVKRFILDDKIEHYYLLLKCDYIKQYINNKTC